MHAQTGHPQTCHAIAALLRARIVLAVAHRADVIKRHWRFLADPPVPLHLLTLAPHVQMLLQWVY